MIYVTSDTHFDHANIIKFCNRPFDNVSIMNKTIISNWNSVVNKDDIVYFLGDFTFSRSLRRAVNLLNSLNGFKKVLFGNHDNSMRRLFNLINSKYELAEDGIARSELDQVEFLGEYHERQFPDRKYIMCHYPLQEWNGAHRGSIHLHGHTHNSETNRHLNSEFRVNIPGRINVCQENWNYTPIKVSDLV